MKGKVSDTKEFDRVLRVMLMTKPLSKEEISARIRARRKAKQKEKQVGRSKRSKG
jgi:DNA-binding response OmpR family regulator